MAGSILGTAVQRVEDPALLTGARPYTDDLRRREHPDALHLAFVRSDIAHGLISAIDVSDAVRHQGVVAVYRATDLGLAPFSSLSIAPVPEPFLRPPMAVDTVRFVGEAVAVVVADSPVSAVDAASLVVVDYDPLPVVVDPADALAPDAPLLFPEMGTNTAATFADEGDDPGSGGEGPRVLGLGG